MVRRYPRMASRCRAYLLLYGSTRFTVRTTVDYVLPCYSDRGGGVESQEVVYEGGADSCGP